jgi:CRP-like cAMP-binding protein
LEKWKLIILQSKLFQGFTEIELEKFLSKAHGNLESFQKGQIVANEETPCTHIGIVISGIIDVQKTYPSGKFITINHLEKGEMFGEVIVFSNRKTFPATLITQTKSQVYFLKKEELMQLNQAYPLLMENFMKVLSQKILILNQRVKSLSYHTLRQRIIDYILEIYKKQNAMMFQLPVSRKQMADRLGTTRPSLSRELAKMKDEGLIDYEKNGFKILDLERLEAVLFE